MNTPHGKHDSLSVFKFETIMVSVIAIAVIEAKRMIAKIILFLCREFLIIFNIIGNYLNQEYYFSLI
ncbi:MAG: hypothetical protein ACFE85_11260 [Candidatus Hodarchaeota archaeon]